MAQRYMFLLYGSEDWWDTADENEVAAMMHEHEKFTAAVEAAGAKIVGGEALHRQSTATTVRTGSAPAVTDGPFLESKEALGGFYLIETEDLDHAVALAKKCPETGVEIRPVWNPPEQ